MNTSELASEPMVGDNATIAEGYYAGPSVRLMLAPNFDLREFASADTAVQVIVSLRLVRLLQGIRDRVGRPVIVASGYRTVAHNQAIGGAKHSQHLYGRAADIQVRGYAPDRIAGIARELGAAGIGVYPRPGESGWTHVDVRPGARTEWRG